MNWYNAFNTVEACLWAVVTVIVLCRVPCTTRQQRAGVVLGGVAFLVFGVTDLLELGREGVLPLWLWGLKIACGIAIISARYTWIGWSKFHWRDREVLFGLGCLIAVVVVISCQRVLHP